jgi:hypothetical protein
VDYVSVKSSTGKPAYSPSGQFVYTRRQDEFEQVTAYFWITESEKHLQSLGFGRTYPAINNYP